MGRPKRVTPTGFGLKLKALREAAGLTQQQLADKTEMNRFGVAKLEQGTRDPNWSTVLRMAAALGVTCEAFDVASSDAPPAAKGKAAGKPAGKRKPGKGA